jgi:hypothetical protein
MERTVRFDRMLRPAIVAALLFVPAPALAEVIVRWDTRPVPSPGALGVAALAVPAGDAALVRDARAAGYRVFLDADADALDAMALPESGLAGVLVRGAAGPARLDALRARLGGAAGAVRAVDERGKWPHIRANWVTSRNGVLQVASRTAQPWIENNAALIRIARAERPGDVPLLTYAWQPITPAVGGEEPSVDDYLVAIAEAGSFGADLLLPLHAAFQHRLALGMPDARAEWGSIRAAIAFHAAASPALYEPIAGIAVVTGPEPMRWFEAMNLLARHNLPFRLVGLDRMDGEALKPFRLAVVLDRPDSAQAAALEGFARGGGIVVSAGLPGPLPWARGEPVARGEGRAEYEVGGGRAVVLEQPPIDPNAFALAVRQMLPAGARDLEIWNGITVIAAPYASPQAQPGDGLESARVTGEAALVADAAHPMWRDAPRVTIDRTYLGDAVPGPPTEVRSRWTDQDLYLLFICPYDTLNLKPDPDTAAETRRLWGWDVAEAFLGSDHDHIGAYREYQVSPQGEWIDLDIDRDHQDRQGGMAWNSGFTVAARIDRDAKIWYGAMRIPFASLGVAEPRDGLELRAGLYRISGADPRTYHAWRPTGQKNFHVPEAFGVLRLR